MTNISDLSPLESRRARWALYIVFEGASLLWLTNFSFWKWGAIVLSLILVSFIFYFFYVCERFSTLYFFNHAGAVGSFALASAGVAHRMVVDDIGWTQGQALLLNVGILLSVAVAYFAFYFSGGKTAILDVQEGKVVSVDYSSPGRDGYAGGMLAGVGTLVGAWVVNSVGLTAAGILGSLLIWFCCLAIIFYTRHELRGVRNLRLKEKKMATIFTFKNIDAVREARRRWWPGRLFRWLLSWRGSTN